jgi:trimeric autotransporter adhesin
MAFGSQAAVKKFFAATFLERKKMSTKTITKRIALVAVATLGAGVLAAAPAFAAAATATAVAPKSSAANVSSDLGTVTFGNITAGASDTYAVNVLTGPAGGVLTVEDLAGNGTDTTHTVGAGASNYTDGGAAGAAGALTVTGKFSLPGTYTVEWGATTTIVGTYTVTGQRNSIAALIADGVSEVAATATNRTTANGVVGSFNTVTVGVISGNGVAVAGGNTIGTSGRRTLVEVSGAGATITSSTRLTVAENKLSAVTSTADMTFASNPGAIVINTPQAGTVTVKSYLETANSGIFSATADQTVTITVGTAAVNGVLSVANSTAVMAAVAAAPAVAGVDDVISAANGAGATAQAANIVVSLQDGAKNALTGQTVTAVITGPGLLGYNATEATTNEAATARAVSGGQAAGTSASASVITVWPDKTGAGVATVTISVGTTVIATKTITFTGDAKTISAGALKPHILVGSAPDAVWVLAVDSANNPVSYSPVATSSSTATVASSLGSCATASAAEQLLGAPKGSNVCDITGSAVGTATLTIAAGSTTTNSPTVAIRVTKSVINAITLTTDKPTYAPGEKITLTLTARDADAQLIGAGDFTVLAAAQTTSQALTGTAFPNTAITFNAGVATTSYFAPLVAGPVTFSATTSTNAALATAVQTSALAVTAEVEGDSTASLALDAANAATDAANNAYDEAQNATQAASDALAAVTALAAQVKSLIASVKKLTAAVAKLRR